MIDSKKIEAYIDGACKGNPGPGGWSVILTNGTDVIKELSGGFRNTTNNRMELLALVKCLEYIIKEYASSEIKIFSDSSYVVNSINKKWLKKWSMNGWKTSNKSDVQNADLWKDALACLKMLNVQIIHIKGHSGITFNERADELASNEAKLKAYIV